MEHGRTINVINHPPVITIDTIVGTHEPFPVMAGLWHCYTHITIMNRNMAEDHCHAVLWASGSARWNTRPLCLGAQRKIGRVAQGLVMVGDIMYCIFSSLHLLTMSYQPLPSGKR